MSKPTIVASIAVLAGSVAAVLLLGQNAELREKVETLEVEVVRYREALSSSHETPSGLATKVAGEQDLDAGADDPGPGSGTSFSAASLQKILGERDPVTRLKALLDYVARLELDDIPGALRALRESTPEWDPDAKVAAQVMLARWAKADPDSAFAYVEGMDYKKGGGDAAVVLGALAAQDPERAIKWLENPDNKMGYLPWMGHILAGTITKEWARSDPDAALAWAKTVPDNQRTGAYIGVLGPLAATDPARAGALATALEPSRGRTDVIGQIAKSWSEQAPQAALEWAFGLEGNDRDRAIGESLGGWAQSDPRAAADFIGALPEDEREADYAARVASTWARQEPAEATQWLAAQPDDPSRTRAMGQVMWDWTVADPQAASTWLVDQPPGALRDSAIGALSKATFETDPEGAVTWYAAMSNGEQRAAAVDRGVRRWLREDEPAARQWIGSTDALTPEEVQKFSATGTEAAAGGKD